METASVRHVIIIMQTTIGDWIISLYLIDTLCSRPSGQPNEYWLKINNLNKIVIYINSLLESSYINNW